MYILDTNIFINFYDRYYRFAYFPSFWENLIPILNSRVIIPKVVINETTHSTEFVAWINSHFSNEKLNHTQYTSQYTTVLQHVLSCGFYKPEALNSEKGWANEKIADAWIIAIAMKENYTIVTEENRVINLNRINPSKAAKIPDVSDQLGIRCINMNQFFEEVQFKL